MQTTQDDPRLDARTTLVDSTRTAGTPSEAVATPRSDVAGTNRTGVWRRTFLSLENRDFRYLWLSMLLMTGLVQMQMLAAGYLVFEITSSSILLGLTTMGFALPMLCLSPLGGAISDRLERKRIIQIGQISFGLTNLFLGVSVTTGTVTWVHILGVGLFQGVLYAFMLPAVQASIPQLVGKDRLTNAMALNAMGMSVMSLLAPSAAGILYAAAGPDVLYFVICTLGITAALPIARLPRLTAGDAESKATILGDIGAGVSYIRRSPLVLVLLLMGLAMAILSMPFRSLLPVFVVDIYHRGPGAMGLLLSMLGAGSLVGAFLIAALGNKWKRGVLLMAGSLLTGTVLVLAALLPYFFVALGLMALLGLGVSGHNTLNHALIMEVTEDQYRGRVISIFQMNYALMPLGVIPAGIAAQFVGGQVAIGVLAVLLLATAMGVLITQKGLRDMR